MEYTIYYLDKVAKDATKKIAEAYAENGYKNPPNVSNALARIVLECAKEIAEKEPDKVKVD